MAWRLAKSYHLLSWFLFWKSLWGKPKFWGRFCSLGETSFSFSLRIPLRETVSWQGSKHLEKCLFFAKFSNSGKLKFPAPHRSIGDPSPISVSAIVGFWSNLLNSNLWSQTLRLFLCRNPLQAENFFAWLNS